jgi:hypothetical protein
MASVIKTFLQDDVRRIPLDSVSSFAALRDKIHALYGLAATAAAVLRYKGVSSRPGWDSGSSRTDLVLFLVTRTRTAIW